MDVAKHNREAWDRQVAAGNRWTVPVGPEVDRARPHRGLVESCSRPPGPYPGSGSARCAGRRILALASGGGQQGPSWPPPARA